MAYRATWSGSLKLNALFQAPVSVVLAADDYEGATPLREVCECHAKPFVRTQVCVGGKRRQTATLVKAGDLENTTRMVKAAQTGDDSYAIVSDDAIRAVDEATASDVLEPIAVLPYGQAPMEAADGVYFLRANEKIPGATAILAVLHRALQADGNAIVCKWAPRGREHLAVIHPVGDALYLNTLCYAAEMREPQAAETAHIGVNVGREELALARELLGTLPDTLDYQAQEDSSVAPREKAIAAAIAGKPIKGPEKQPAPTGAPDLLAALRAASAGAKPRAKAPAKRAARKAVAA